MEKNQPNERLTDLPVQTENIHFKPEEMILCAKCQRTNPPTRLNCFYCGGEMKFSDAQSKSLKPNLRKLESWEKGFNVILLSGAASFDETKLTETSRLLKIEKEFLQRMIEVERSLPIARAESEKESEIVQTRLSEFGIKTRVVSDESLAIEKPARRLRGIEFFEDKLNLILFNQDAKIELPTEDVALIVTGAIFERKISATEKYNKKGENKILDTSETATDEILIDVFSRLDSIGYRIYARGFDFSSLAVEKELLAKNNIIKLGEKLRRFAPNVKYIDDYLLNRSLLASVWEVEQKTDSQGMKRDGVGKFNFGNVTTVSNQLQFTKYSRLQWHLL